jgi:NADH-quinone oxidoreductase subunit N
MYSVFGNLKEAWLYAISFLGILSMTVGNLFAMRQTNIKRLLAFSSISQVGFVLIGVAGASQTGATSVVYFVFIYLLSNIAAFGVVGAIADATGHENLDYYKGLYKSHPFFALILALSLFSLAGIPPTAGFFGKLFLLMAGMGNAMYVMLGFAAINLVLSVYNYMRVVRIMFLDEAAEALAPVEKNKALSFTLVVCVAGIVIIGFITPLYNYISSLI